MALSLPQFDGFERDVPLVHDLTTLTRYDRDYAFEVMFEKEVPTVTLGEVVAEHGLAQLRAAETEKYPHVTFFFSGGREQPFAGEERLLIGSPDVETYDLQPQMSAAGITEGVVTALQSKRFALLVVNYANGDMVGHTGVPAAVIEAVEVVDESVGKLCECAVKNGYSVVLTADHGNADMLVDPVTGTPHTKHTTFPVACTVIDKQAWRLNNGAGLPAIAPTILQLLGLRQPQQMTGESLLLEALE
jgi:2,3-bisphosphoglycerate-independent phosphoglycerate mutase